MADTRTSMTIKPDLKDYRELLKALNVMDDAAKVDLKNEV